MIMILVKAYSILLKVTVGAVEEMSAGYRKLDTEDYFRDEYLPLNNHPQACIAGFVRLPPAKRQAKTRHRNSQEGKWPKIAGIVVSPQYVAYHKWLFYEAFVVPPHIGLE